MRLTIGDYEVEVKARSLYNEKMNAKDTQYFLNRLSSSLYQASLKNTDLGWEFRAEDDLKMSNQIYEALDAKGFYDDIRKNA